jgi:hypothetical protein
MAEGTTVPGDRGPEPSDDPLTAAGELRRAPQPPPLESDGSGSVTPDRRGSLVPVGLAVAVGALIFATHQIPPEPAPASGIVPSEPAIVPAAGLIVRDGDLVEASGPVEDSKMCSPAPDPLIIGAPCQWGIWVPGVGPTGGVTLRGRWHRGGLSDIQRMPYSPTWAGSLGPGHDFPDAPPCPAPAGGWRDGEDWDDEQVRDYLNAHAEQFAEPFATHVGNARILVVKVVSGDVDQARAALTAIYTDNLCVVADPGGHSIAAEGELQATTGKAVGALMDGTGRSGIYMATSENGKIRVMMLQLTQPLYDKFAAIGLDQLILDPWIRPAGP